MICEKCERIGRLNMIPHLVVEAVDDIAEFAECPWDWEKEEMEQYMKVLHLEEIEEALRNNLGTFGRYESLTQEQKDELEKIIIRICKKYDAMMNML